MRKNIKIHPSAEVADGALIGDNTVIWQNCIIQGGAEVGEGCSIGANVFIEKGVKIGSHVKIKNNVALYTGVICEDDVFLGPNCVFTNVMMPRSFVERKNEFRRTVVRRGGTVGANATIICGNEIGEYAMVGAAAVVTEPVPPHALVVGNPAHITGYVCLCGERLLDGDSHVYTCARCGTCYCLAIDTLVPVGGM